MKSWRRSSAVLVMASLTVMAACEPEFITTLVDMCTGEQLAAVDGMSSAVPQTAPYVPRAWKQQAPASWTTSHAIVRHQNELFAVDRDNGNLVVVDVMDLSVLRTIAVGKSPEEVIVGPNGDAWVSVRGQDYLAKVAAGAAAVTSVIKVGTEPIGMAMNADGSQLYVAVSGEGKVMRVDTTSLGVELHSEHERASLRAVAYAHSAEVLYVVDVNAGIKAFDMKLGGSSTPVASRNLREANPGHLLASFSNTTLRPWRATAADIHPETGTAMVPHVLTSTGDLNSPSKMVEGDLSGGGGGGGDTYGSGGGMSCNGGTPVRPVEVSVTSFGKTHQTQAKEFAVADPDNGRLFIARFDQPSDIVHHPNVSLTFVTSYGTDNVMVLNSAFKDPMRFPIAELKVGMAPKGLTFSADGKTAYVLNQHGFSISQVDLSPLVSLAVTSYPTDKPAPQIEPMTLEASRTAAFAKDPATEELQLGRRLFTFTNNKDISKANRFACASCHLEGGDDKQTWVIDSGLRQTPSLAGRLSSTGPFNWLGTEQHLKDNMNDTISRMGGTGLSHQDLSALEQFMLHGLPERPNPYRGEALTEQQERGKALFFSAETGCAGCHVNGDGSDGINWDVGVAKASETNAAIAAGKLPFNGKLRFNTPSLRGVWASAPYFHNGSAKTLKAALLMTKNTMGKTSHLSSSELDDLVAYLRTL